MHIHIVVEPHAGGSSAASLGLNLACRLGADITLHRPLSHRAIEGGSLPLLEATQAAEQSAARALGGAVTDEAASALRARGLVQQEVVTRDEAPLKAVLRLVAERDSSLVVVGLRGGGTAARIEADALVADLAEHCPVPVVVCREDCRQLPNPASGHLSQP